jgi:L-methionine (R)-S-oxide reductase
MVDHEGNIDKIRTYSKINEQLSKFFEKYDKDPKLSLTAKMASLSSVVKSHFEDLKFVGFYVVHEENNILEIGPYVSDILATPKIGFGKGVCGTCWEEKKTVIINNVAKCKNYIACDEATQSEIVLPVFKDDKIIAVWDVDSIEVNRFDPVDESNLEKLIKTYLN